MNRDLDRCVIEINRKSSPSFGLRFASNKGSEMVFFFTDEELRDLQAKIETARSDGVSEVVIPYNR